MATYGSGQMLGSGINPESFKQDYSGFTRAAEIQAQGLSNLGGSIAGAIKDYGQAKQERKKLDAGIKATVTGIESAIKMGDSLGIDVKSSLTPYLDKINDPNVTPTEAAAYAQEASSAIGNILNFGMKANQLGMEENQNIRAAMIKQAQIDAEANKPGSLETIAVPGGTQQMIRNPQTGIFEPIKIAEDINAALNLPSLQMNQQLPGGNGTAMDGAPGVLPSINDPMNAAAEAIAYANRMTGGRTDISDLSPVPTGVSANQPSQAPRIDSLPSVAMLTTPKTRLGFAPTKGSEQETFRPATAEESAPYGGVPGQISSKGRFYPINLPTGMTIETNADGSLKVVQGAGVGSNKNEKVAEERQKQQSSFLDEFTKTAAETIKLLPSLPDNPVGAKFGAALGQLLPASEQGRVVSRLNTLKANLALDKVNEMRAASPTGGAAGNMTEKEWPLFMQAFGSLDAAENRQDLEERLKNASIKLFNRINGTPEQRQSAIEKGTITKQENKIVQKKYDEMLSSLGLAPVKSAVAPSSDSQSVYDKYLSK